MLGLIAAVPEEIAHLDAGFSEGRADRVAGLTFRVGRLDGRDAVLVEAGPGKVNAAVVATLLCRDHGCRALLFSGVAGGLDPALGIGDVVIATRLVQHDYGAVVAGRFQCYQPGVPPLPGFDERVGYDLDPALLGRIRAALAGVRLPPLSAKVTGGEARVPNIHFGTVVTGDTFVNCEATAERLRRTFGALAVEMEGAAVAQVAQRFAVPSLVVRSLSDRAGADSHMDFPSFVRAAAEGSAILVRWLAAVI